LTLKGHGNILEILKCPLTTTPRPLPLATAGSR